MQTDRDCGENNCSATHCSYSTLVLLLLDQPHTSNARMTGAKIAALKSRKGTKSETENFTERKRCSPLTAPLRRTRAAKPQHWSWR